MIDKVEPPWRISSKGACWCWYEEITDPELLSILKAEDGFKIEHDGYEYSVKINDNGSIPVFLKQTKAASNSQNLRSTKRFIPEDYPHKNYGNSRIVDIRFESIDEIQDILEDGNWEISEYNPVCEIKGEVVVVLVKRQGVEDTIIGEATG